MAQVGKNRPPLQEAPVQPQGWEDPLEKGMATHSSVIAWRIPQTEESGRLQSMELQVVGQYWATNSSTFHFINKCVCVCIYIYIDRERERERTGSF